MTKKEINDKPALFIFYDYFYPGYKAGGPIQSLVNLVLTLQPEYNISVITSAFDLRSAAVYRNLKTNSWTTISLPGGALPVNIWYAKNKLSAGKLYEILSLLQPTIIYLNGLFSYRFFLLPLIATWRLKYRPKVVICPRGMLQAGALSGRPLKKQLYLTTLKHSGLLKKKYWHATNLEEQDDIHKVFGAEKRTLVAPNIPKKPAENVALPAKQNSRLRLIYLSLIAEKKNLLLTLQMIKNCPGVTLDIYGPVKDRAYWQSCEKLIAQMPENVQYKGDVIPGNVQEVFRQYDASILLTKGENFGHALYESLSVGRPVITSDFTPWMNLQPQKAGWNIGITSIEEGISLLHDLSDMPASEFADYCTGAHQMALDYYSGLNSISTYKRLFQCAAAGGQSERGTTQKAPEVNKINLIKY